MPNYFPENFARRVCLLGLSCAIVFASSLQLFAESPDSASTSKKSRDAAIKSIPFHNINDATKTKLAPILKSPSVYRRMPVQTFRCDSDMHTFLVRHPEVIVNIWQLMGISSLSAKRVAPYQITSSDGAGTNSDIELVYGTPNLHVFYGVGLYKGNLLHKPVKGKCIIVLRSEFGEDRSGAPIVRDRMDFFLKMDNAGFSILAKTLNPLIGKSADHNFLETAKFLSKISEAAEANSVGVQRMAQKLTNCDANIRKKFGDVASNVGYRAALRSQQNLPGSTIKASYQKTARR